MIEISRADIISDHIVETNDPRRFIKIPIDGYLDLLGVVPNGPQIAMINAINNPKYRFICAAISRRLGKTYISNLIGQMVSLVPGSSVLIMSPNYSLSQISFDLQRQLIKHFDLEVERDNAKDKIITLSNGSNIRMGSVSQADSVVGRSYDLIIFDEAALSNDGRDAFNIQLRPTLDKENSKCIFISTPRGSNYFAEFFQRGFSPAYPEWASIHATYHENDRISQADIEEAQKTMSKAEFAQEYLAEFTTYEGKIYNFDRDICICDCSDDYLSNDFDIIIGVDWGYRDPTAMVVVAYSHSTEQYFVIDEYQEAEKTTEEHAEALQTLVDRWNADFIFVDSAQQQTRYDLAQIYGISTVNAKKSVLGGIGRLASLFDNEKIYIDEDCKMTIQALDQYQWDTREGLTKERPVHNDASHLADALRYCIYSFTTSIGVY